jgi:hypothetical protein
MDPFNALSITAAARKIPPLKEAPPAKVMSSALVASPDLEKNLDAVKEVTGEAGVPLAKMAGRPANSPRRSQPWFVAIRPLMMRATHHQCAKVPLVPRPWNTAGSCSFPSSNDWEGASIDQLVVLFDRP